MDVLQILNTIRANSSAGYQERVPEATQSNMERVGNAIMSFEHDTNEFLNGLVNRIAFTVVSNRRYSNPLAMLKKGSKPFGTDIEEIFTNPVAAVTYDGSNTSDMLKVTKPDVKTIFHRMNRQDKYPVSINEASLTKAFTNAGEMSYFIESVINAMYSGDEVDEYLLMRNTISKMVTDNKAKVFEVPYDGQADSSKELIKLVKTLSTNMTFPSKEYNAYNVLNKTAIEGGTITPCTTWCPKENQILLIRSDVDASTDVEVLAKAFNMDKTDFMARKFVVDTFDDPDTLCAIGDINAFRFYDDLYKTRSFPNGSNLVTNYWLHHWQTLSINLFANLCFIKSKATA